MSLEAFAVFALLPAALAHLGWLLASRGSTTTRVVTSAAVGIISGIAPHALHIEAPSPIVKWMLFWVALVIGSAVARWQIRGER